MPRHKSEGLPFIGLPTNWFRLPEHKILRAKFGMSAMLIWTELFLSAFEIYGYYVMVTDDDISVLAMEYGVKENLIREVLHFLAQREMVDSSLLRSDKVLTSKEIQRKYQYAMRSIGQKRDVEIYAPYWLLDRSETSSFIKLCTENTSGNYKNKSEKNTDKSEKYKEKSEINVHDKKRKDNITISKTKIRRKRLFSGRFHVMSVKERAEKIKGLYNAVCVPLGLSRSGRLSDLQIRYIREGLKRGYKVRDYEDVFHAVGESDFLQGKGKSSKFCATFSWLIKPEKMVCVLAGEYRNYSIEEKEKPSSIAASSFDVDDFFAASMARAAKTNTAADDDVLPWLKGE